MKALIVEDEPRARRVLENLLRTHFPEVEVAGMTASVKETVAWLARMKADVIFMDVELSDGNCFDIFAQTAVDAHVVMTTAYDNYAVKAFEVNSVASSLLITLLFILSILLPINTKTSSFGFSS